VGVAQGSGSAETDVVYGARGRVLASDHSTKHPEHVERLAEAAVVLLH
jgi:hypothetical protein